MLGPRGASTATITLLENEYLDLVVRSQTPGLIHMPVNGLPLDTCKFWDYDASGSSFVNPAEPASRDLGVRAGEPMTISVSAEYTTGDWYVALVPRT